MDKVFVVNVVIYDSGVDPTCAVFNNENAAWQDVACAVIDNIEYIHDKTTKKNIQSAHSAKNWQEMLEIFHQNQQEVSIYIREQKVYSRASKPKWRS